MPWQLGGREGGGDLANTLSMVWLGCFYYFLLLLLLPAATTTSCYFLLPQVGVAVAGYSSEGSNLLWRETVASSLTSLPDPALRHSSYYPLLLLLLFFCSYPCTPRAVFTFLTCQDDTSYSTVLREEGLLLADRLGQSGSQVVGVC